MMNCYTMDQIISATNFPAAHAENLGLRQHFIKQQKFQLRNINCIEVIDLFENEE